MPFWIWLLILACPAITILECILRFFQKKAEKDALKEQKIKEEILSNPSPNPLVKPSVEPSVEPSGNIAEDKYMKIWEGLSFGEKAYATLTYEERVKFDEWRQYTTLSLDNARERVIKLLLKQDLDKAIDVTVEAITTDHPEFFAVERHFFLIDIIDKFYAMREIREDAVGLCYGLCLLDIDYLHYYIQETGRIDFYAVSPTRAAIIMEKAGGIEEAIEICDRAIELGVLDSNKQSFEIRKERLKKKLEKQKQKEQKEKARKE